MHRLTMTEESELRLDSYVMHIHQTLCSRCGCGERYSEMFEVWIHPSKTYTTGFKQLRRTANAGKTVLADLHIAYMEIPERSIPICSDCIHTYKSASDQTPLPALDAQAWAETLKRKYAPATAAKPQRASTAGGKDIPTLEDL